jgi:hypothetical protein
MTIPGIDASLAELGDAKARALQLGPDIVGGRPISVMTFTSSALAG